MSILVWTFTFSQDMINAYKASDYIGQPGVPYYNHPLGNGYFAYPNDRHITYNGEYVIYAGNLPFFNSNTRPFLGPYDPDNFIKTYTIETVSFPFSTECAFTTGCADLTLNTIRDLSMPPLNSYDLNTMSWSYGGGSGSCNGPECRLKNTILQKEVHSSGYTQKAASDPTTIEGQSLVSSFFVKSSPAAHTRDVLPHTVLKHTITYHCGNLPTSQPIASISFIYDNTRGYMRKYPFFPTNTDKSGQNLFYDILFVPVIFDASDHGDYAATENCNFYGETTSQATYCSVQGYSNIKGGSIDYFPFTELSRGCQFAGFTDVTGTNQIYRDGTGQYNIQTPPFSLVVNTFARNFDGTLFAGLEPAQAPATGMAQIGADLGYVFPVHNYFVDNSIDLEDINQSEKKIYNPSEVDITAPDLRFPANYTFLTARGVYAYIDDYTAQTALPENDFAFYNNDLRSFPIETDLRYEGINPDYLGHPNDPRYSSIYRLMNGSKLTIEPCVHIYDCTFDVNPGAEMVFENWPTNQHNVNRYNVLKNGGTITKRDNSFLFQNRNEVEFILKFEAGDFIRAGESVDLSSPTGTYSVLANSEVHFTANNYIDLQPGFNADANSTFTASINSIVIPGCPPQRKRKPQGVDNDLLPESKTYKFFHASPNPATDEISLMFGIKNSTSVTLLIYDVYGKLVSVIAENKFLNFGEYSYKYKIGNLSNGIYFARLSTADETEAIRFIKH